MTIILLAVLCAVILSVALHPLMNGPDARTGWKFLFALAAASLGLYLALGSPDAKTAPALFENSGPRFEQRMASQRELIVLEALSGKPDHVPLLLELGTLRVQSGHAQDALEPLEKALKHAPGDTAVKEALGAAHYSIALTYAAQPRKDARPVALSHFEQAVKLTPKSADFYERLKADRAAYLAR